MVLAMSPAHPLAAKSPLPITRLDGENLIAFRHGSSVRHAMDQALERAERFRGSRSRIRSLLIRAAWPRASGSLSCRARSPSSKGRRSRSARCDRRSGCPSSALARGELHSAARAFLDFVAASVAGSAKIEA